MSLAARLSRAFWLRWNSVYLSWLVSKVRGRRFFFSRNADADYPLVGRSSDTDRQVYKQIFCEREYAPLIGLANVDTIIDLGANVGYSAAFFLSKFRYAQLIAVEPDVDNLEMLAINLRPYHSRVDIVPAAIWSAETRLDMRVEPYRGGGSWAKQVEKSVSESGAIRGVDIPWILKTFQIDTVSLLKIDIEGAEVELFSAGVDAWIGRVRTIVIELHDDSAFGNATGTILPLLSRHGFEFKSSGEFTICTRSNDAANLRSKVD